MENEKASLAGVWFYLRPFTMKIINGLAWMTLVILWVNYLYGPWPLFLNPLKDFLFTRCGGPFFYGNHLSSVIAIMLSVSLMVFRDRIHAARQFIVAFSIVPIHEFLLPSIDWLVTYRLTNVYAFYFFGSSSNFKYMFELAIILAIALAVATKKQRKRMGLIALILTAFILVWVITLDAFAIPRMTIIGFSPGPDFYGVIPNAFEVFSWILAAIMWVPKVE
jgi:hypothetical protein